MQVLSKARDLHADRAAVATYPIVALPGPANLAGSSSRVLRNTYALLSMTLLFSAAVAALSLALGLPAPGILLSLAGMFGLLFQVHKVQNSAWALPAVFAFTGFMGYMLGRVRRARQRRRSRAARHGGRAVGSAQRNARAARGPL